MRRSIFILAATALAASALAGCEDRQSRPEDGYQPPVEHPAETEEGAGEPVVAPEVTDPAPTPPEETPPPPQERTSEQSVQPESETLFY
jgi:hypothetical protein